jgi:chemotaxis protein MotB
MSACGYAQYRPIATNATALGREKNRRVELRFYGQKNEEDAKLPKSLLDQGAK